MRVTRNSAWTEPVIAEYLEHGVMPLRVACNGAGGFPLINSLWFVFEDDSLWCAVHRDAVLARRLGEDSRCGFELAPNDPPYLGVRGQGHARVRADRGAEVLAALLDRFLGEGSTRLRRWLLGRADEEVALQIVPTWISAWDYRDRMDPPAGAGGAGVGR